MRILTDEIKKKIQRNIINAVRNMVEKCDKVYENGYCLKNVFLTG